MFSGLLFVFEEIVLKRGQKKSENISQTYNASCSSK